MTIPEHITSILMSWFQDHRRDMPWRGSDDPYHIWVSEMMLQQTQVVTVMPYFHRWIEKFPNVEALAAASMDDILKVWEGLGYYTRARNFKKGANYIINNHTDTVSEKVVYPVSEDDWLKVPGVGPYTAAAVSSIAFQYPAGVVDGNVIRIMSRLFALNENSRTIAFKKKIKTLVEGSFYDYHPGWVNQAWMEFGSLQCTPSPNCGSCVLSQLCKAFQTGKTDCFPVKPPKKKIPLRIGKTYLIKKDDLFFLVRRKQEGFLGGLWEFPNDFEGKTKSTDDPACFIEKYDLQTVRSLTKTVKHSYSHFHQKMSLYSAELASVDVIFYGESQGWFTMEEMHKLPRSGIQIKLEKMLTL